MAGELQAIDVSGLSVDFYVFDYQSRIWSVSGLAFEAYQVGHLANYVIAGVEKGGFGLYVADTPIDLPKGEYSVVAKRRLSGSASESDLVIAAGTFEYPQLWTRFFGVAIKDNNAATIVTKDRDGNMVASQAFTSVGGVDTVNGAT